MPKPEILPQIDWQSVFESGETFDDWIQHGEKDEHRTAMAESRGSFDPGAPAAASVKALPQPVSVIAIAEDWCPDVVRHVPVLQRLADLSPRVEVRYIAREAHPDVLARFLTCGGEAVPKFIFFNEHWVQCGEWGPMPADCKPYIARGRACGDLKAARGLVSKRYESDPNCRVVVAELLAELTNSAATAP